jgi:hypothetical protein
MTRGARAGLSNSFDRPARLDPEEQAQFGSEDYGHADFGYWHGFPLTGIEQRATGLLSGKRWQKSFPSALHDF